MNQSNNCYQCNSPLISIGYFCGTCLTQVKCKQCGEDLYEGNIGCISCGTPLIEKKSNILNLNTFKLQETRDERNIEATFSDEVGKDLTIMLRDTLTTFKNQNSLNLPLSNIKMESETQDVEFEESVKQDPIDNKSSIVDNSEYPTLLAIAMKNLPSSEVEWLVIYSFYVSEFGKKTFSRENIVSGYKSANKFNKSTTKDLSKYIQRATVQGYINPLENSYSILYKGIEKAHEILSRTASSVPRLARRKNSSQKNEKGELATETKTTSRTKQSYQNAKKLSNVDFYPSGKESLVDYFKKFQTKNDSEKNLVFCNYFLEILNISPITLDHIYTCYDELNIKIPTNIKSSINNTKTRGWLELNDNGIGITTKGRNKIKFWDRE